MEYYSKNIIPRLSLDESVASVLKKYATFTGRARRSEYWWFVLWILIIGAIFFIAQLVLMYFSIKSGSLFAYWDSTFYMVLMSILSIFSLAILLPYLAVTVRRLHDINKSGWNIILFAIPIIGAILHIVWMCQDSDITTNKYGVSPKYMGSDEPDDISYSNKSSLIWVLVIIIVILVILLIMSWSGGKISLASVGNEPSQTSNNYSYYDEDSIEEAVVDSYVVDTYIPDYDELNTINQQNDIMEIIANNVGNYPYKCDITDNAEFTNRFSKLIGSDYYKKFKSNNILEVPIRIYDNSGKYGLYYWDKDEDITYYIICDKPRDNITVFIEEQTEDERKAYYAQEQKDLDLVNSFNQEAFQDPIDW